MTELLARSIGTCLSRRDGLFRAEFPAALGTAFFEAARDGANEAREDEHYAVVVTEDGRLGSIKSEAAAARRSRDDEGRASALVLSRSGDFKEIKTLEAFKLANPGVVAGGIGDELVAAELQIEELCDEVASHVAVAANANFDVTALGQALLRVARFLGSVYENAGNDEIAWTDAWWLHLRLAAEKLSDCLDHVPALGDEEVVAAHVSAGLPVPDHPSAGGYGRRRDGKRYSSRVLEKWTGAEEAGWAAIDIEDAERKLGNCGPDDRHPLRSLGWETLASTRASLRHPVLALCFHRADAENWIAAWGSTSETAFFEGAGVESGQEASFALLAHDGSGWKEAPRVDAGDKTVYVAPPALAKPTDGGIVALGRFKLEVAANFVEGAPAPIMDVTCSPRSLAATPVGGWTLQVDGTAVLEVELAARARPGFWREKPFKISVSPIDQGSRLALRGDVSIEVYVPPPGRPGIFVVQYFAGKTSPKPLFHPPLALSFEEDGLPTWPSDEEGVASFELASNARSCEAIVVAPTAPTVELGGVAAILDQVSADWQGIVRLGDLPTHEMTRLDCEGFEAILDRADDRGHLSPLAAATTGGPVLADVGSEVVDHLRLDPRALLEDWLAKSCISNVPSDEFQRALGIVSVSGREGDGTSRIIHDPGSGTFSDGAYASVRLLPDVGSSPEVQAFWRAFERLELGRFPSEAGTITSWPSRLDLRSLSTDRVEEYLLAYLGLLELARGGQGKALAAFPFSCVVCEPVAGRVYGVMLSPLHPLRLGWNWSLQREADRLVAAGMPSDRVAGLLRFVDGSDLPTLGPSPADGTAMLSSPLASGYQSLFASWSYLRDPGLDAVPVSVLDREFPSGTASGLDHGGVAAAMRDYLRVHPFSTQLEVSLDASTEIRRSRDLDHAVVAAVASASGAGGKALPGGARIIDSPRRRGERLDAEQVLDELHPGGGKNVLSEASIAATFEWSAATASDTRADVRFLETPLAVARVESSSEPASGAGPALPLARSHAWARQGSGFHGSAYNPIIPGEAFQDLGGYGKALRLLETLAGDAPCVRCRLLAAQNLVTASARWTVAGNSQMDPAALSTALQSLGDGSLALWEWRPAFLPRRRETDRNAVRTSRPYTVVARLGPQFHAGVADAASSCMGGDGADVGRLALSELGARGVGLSSLLSMGHRQSIGAMGFFLSFLAMRDWEGGASNDEVRCLLPMDAVASVLEAVSGEVSENGSRKRADLLAVCARRRGYGYFDLSFHPVEVKMRTGAAGRFPTSASSEVREALRQLENSWRVLSRLGTSWEDEATRGPLLFNALSTLLESALSLRAAGAERNPGLERDLLDAAANGRCELSVSPGSLLWFQANGRSSDGSLHETRVRGELEPAAHFVDPAELRQSIEANVSHPFFKEVAEAMPSAGAADRPVNSTDQDGSGDDASAQPAAGYGSENSENVEDDVPAASGGAGSEPDGSIGGFDDNDGRNSSGPGGSERPGDGSPPDDGVPANDLDSTSRGIRVVVGSRRRNLETVEVVYEPSDTRLNQLNFGIVGDLGTGKTQFVKSVVYQLSQAAAGNRGVAPKVFIFDYKRDYVDAKFVERVGAKVLDPGSAPLPVNFFALPEGASTKDIVQRAHFFADVIDKVNKIGPVQRDRLYEAVRTAYEKYTQPLISEVLEVYQAEAGKADSVTSTLKLVVDLEVFENNRERLVSFTSLFDRTTVLNLQGLKAGDAVADVVVTLFLDFLYNDYMKGRPKPPFMTGTDGIQRRFVDSFVLVDEAHHIMRYGFDVLEKILLEGREFGMGVILSSQFLSHFSLGNRDWAQPLSTWAIHKVPNVAPTNIQRLGFQGDHARLAGEITGLENLHSLWKCDLGAREGVVIQDKPFFQLVED